MLENESKDGEALELIMLLHNRKFSNEKTHKSKAIDDSFFSIFDENILSTHFSSQKILWFLLERKTVRMIYCRMCTLCCDKTAIMPPNLLIVWRVQHDSPPM